MRKILTLVAVLSFVALLFVLGCDKDGGPMDVAGPSYGGSLNLAKVENWVALEASQTDQKIIKESWKRTRKVRKAFFKEKEGLRKDIEFIKKVNSSEHEVRNGTLAMISMRVGGLIPDFHQQFASEEGEAYFYAIYIAVKEGTSQEDMRFAFLTEGKYMRPEDKDSLEAHGYFRGIKELAKSSAY